MLSGGGFKGAFQVGALEYILNNGITIEGDQVQIKDFDIISGVSVGSLNGALVATNRFEALKKLWFEEIAENGAGIIYKSKYMENGKPNTKKILDDLVPDVNYCKSSESCFQTKRRRVW